MLLLTIVKFPVAISSFFPTLSSADTAFSAVCEDDLPRLANKCGMKSLAVTCHFDTIFIIINLKDINFLHTVCHLEISFLW